MLVVLLVGLVRWWAVGRQPGTPPVVAPQPVRQTATYVGQLACAKCHQEVAAR
jgi:hypothetical protein